MAENKESIDGIIEKLALITDASQSLFTDGKMVIVFVLFGLFQKIDIFGIQYYRF